MDDFKEFYTLPEDRQERYDAALTRLIEGKMFYDTLSTLPDDQDITDKMRGYPALMACTSDYWAALNNMYATEMWSKLNVLGDYELDVVEKSLQEVGMADCVDIFDNLLRYSRDHMDISFSLNDKRKAED